MMDHQLEHTRYVRHVEKENGFIWRVVIKVGKTMSTRRSYSRFGGRLQHLGRWGGTLFNSNWGNAAVMNRLVPSPRTLPWPWCFSLLLGRWICLCIEEKEIRGEIESRRIENQIPYTSTVWKGHISQTTMHNNWENRNHQNKLVLQQQTQVP